MGAYIERVVHEASYKTVQHWHLDSMLITGQPDKTLLKGIYTCVCSTLRYIYKTVGRIFLNIRYMSEQ